MVDVNPESATIADSVYRTFRYPCGPSCYRGFEALIQLIVYNKGLVFKVQPRQIEGLRKSDTSDGLNFSTDI